VRRIFYISIILLPFYFITLQNETILHSFTTQQRATDNMTTHNSPTRILTLLLLVPILAACSHTPDARLMRAESLLEQHPDSALAIIRSIDHKKLNHKNSMYASLLEVKAADKAYITATSDSAIKTLIQYYIDGNREKAPSRRALLRRTHILRHG